jgi:phage terminase large subunit-like protein
MGGEQSLFEKSVDSFGGPEAFLAFLQAQDPAEVLRLSYDWRFLARPKQIMPSRSWSTWSIRAGRGFGKTRVGAETVRILVEQMGYSNGALVGATAADVRDTMIEGPSGIIATSPPWFMPLYEPSKRRLTWPNGAIATLFSAEEPDRLRGPDKDFSWCLEGNTNVTMADGSAKRIDQIAPGDMVATRIGPRIVLAAWRTKRNAEIYEMTASNGASLVCTSNHRIFVNNSYAPLSIVTPGDKLHTWQAKSCCSTESSSILAVGRTTTGAQEGSSCSGSCGSSTTGSRSPGSSSSTTSTGTNSTTGSKTSRRCPGATISRGTARTDGRPGQKKSAEKSSAMGGRKKSHPNGNADIAEGNTCRLAPTAAGAERSAGSQPDITVSQVRRLERRADVYDIQVDEAGEFFANGILVHNCDELASWQRLQDSWDMLMFTLRRGHDPKCIITSTPRGLKLLREIEKDKTTAVTIGSTYENKQNLAAPFLKKIEEKYAGTRLGRQEIDAEILDDNPGALWKRAHIDAKRLTLAEFANMGEVVSRIVVSLDPATTSNASSDENGIVAVGAGWCTCNGKREMHGFVFEDATEIYTPNETCLKVLDVHRRRAANMVVGETNQGGDWIEALLRANSQTSNLRYKGVHAKDGKRLRADPVAALYEQGRVHHVGTFPKLEDEMTQWDPGQSLESPNRVDALVHGLTELVVTAPPPAYSARVPNTFHTSRR